MRRLIQSTDRYDLIIESGLTRFTGCQCINDCSCKEDFKPVEYKIYVVKKKINKVKTTFHNSLEDALKRIELIENI